MRTPRSVVWLWIVAMLFYVAFQFAQISYWEAVLNSATLPPDSDSIGIPIMGTFGTTIVLFPVYLLLALFALRRYQLVGKTAKH